MSQETIFSKILNGEIDCDEVYSDELCLAFRDIEPQAPTHILIIPRKKIISLKELNKNDSELMGHLMIVTAKIARQEGLETWRTIINTGTDAGQTVFHLHIHLMGGRAFKWPPG